VKKRSVRTVEAGSASMRFRGGTRAWPEGLLRRSGGNSVRTWCPSWIM
jgi:hypothetical protein